MSIENFEVRLSNIENMLKTAKDVLSFEEVATYTGLSKSYLYKLTSTGQIPHYKPKGKLLYFSKTDVDAFLLQNRVSSISEVEAKAVNYVKLKKGGAKC